MNVFELWLPILVSAVGVFIVSSVVHMVLPIHKGDYQKLPSEDEIMQSMRSSQVRPGEYMFPCPESMSETANPEMMEKYRRGPVGILNVMPDGPPNMGKSLLQWFLFSVLIGFFVAYLATFTLASGDDFMRVFRLAGTAGVLGYALGHIPNSIWKGQRWSTTTKFVMDGVLYGLTTGLVFAWMWPR